MSELGHLWVIGYDDVARADQVRDEIADLGWGPGRAGKYLILLDIAVVVRHPDGSFTLDQRRRPGIADVLASAGAGFLAGLVLAAPLIGATIGALLGSAGNAAATHVGISDDFIRDAEALMKPGTSAVFILDDSGDMEIILHKIQGLGGKVLKTNVDLKRAMLIQSTLAAAAPPDVDR
jgi:uncharacterized membrane protein